MSRPFLNESASIWKQKTIKLVFLLFEQIVLVKQDCASVAPTPLTRPHTIWHFLALKIHPKNKRFEELKEIKSLPIKNGTS